MGVLYLVATPIGNTGEITRRALDVLAAVPLIASEDTRTTRRLLKAYEISSPRLVSYTEHNRAQRIPDLLTALDAGDVALVSEAGMPGISDPGYELVAAAAEAGHTVSPVGMPSAVLSAIAASGLPSRRFLFLGFLPRKAGARRSALADVAALRATLVVFESPRRVRQTIEDVIAVLGDRRLVAAREISKTHEEFIRGTASEVLALLDNPLGEFTLVIEGAVAPTQPTDQDLESRASQLLGGGASVRDIAGVLSAETAIGRRRAYESARRASEAQ